MFLLEICCFTMEAAILAEKSGADRIELCDNYREGGTTPSIGTVQLAREVLNIPVMVMIRPRGGDFCYSTLEYEIIKRDIVAIQQLLQESVGNNRTIRGIVVGFLLPDCQ